MTISSISDLLALSWTHAYCTEGPEFLAVAPSTSAGLKVGYMDMSVQTGLVGTWPDEIGTDDLTQSLDANKPIYNPGSSHFNSKPSVECSENDLTATSAGSRYMSVDWTDIASPYEWVIVGRSRQYINGAPIIGFGGLTVGTVASFGLQTSGGIQRWSLSMGSTINGGTPDTIGHLFRLLGAATDELRVDEALAVSGGAGSNAAQRLVISRSASASTSGYNDFCFIGIKSGSLTAGERSDIHAFCQSHYGTP